MSLPRTPWPLGVATGIGSLPGTDPVEAARSVLGELPDLPFLAELPGRGPWADLGGRASALLVDLPVDLQPSGWRLVPGRSRDGTRARDLLSRDLDALEEAAQHGVPPVVKIQVAGPWTLAVLLETTRGERVLADHGAVRELTASLAEGLRRHLVDLSRRLPGATIVVQLDEPSLPAVLGALISTSSGLRTYRAPDRQLARDRLHEVLAVAEHTVVHCCAERPPVNLLMEAGASAVSVDATVLTPRDDEALGLAIEAGAGLLLGVVPGVDAPIADLAARIKPVTTLWNRLGFDAELLPERVVLTPTCGLAGASPPYARAALRACVEMGRRLREAPE